MNHNDLEKLYTDAAPKIDLEDEITKEVETYFPFLSQIEKRAIIKSRLNILTHQKPEPVRADLGENISQNSQDDLFE